MAGNQRWYSESFPPTGASFAGGVRNALGRPRLHAHTVLVRETVQNSWDARLSDDHCVEFSLNALHMRGPHLTTLRAYVMDTIPSHLGLWTSLNKPILPVLLVSDRGTSGLGGPTTADQSSETRSDFADFFFNVGRAAGRSSGGGTYGFGKSVLYLASAARSILTYTRCQWNGGYESRLMGSALGDDYIQQNPDRTTTKLTGRHWWGVVSDDDDAVRPVTGMAADALAAALGFPLMTGSQTGTTIMIIDFASEGDRTLASAAADLAWALTWNCWPKVTLGGVGAMRAMRFAVECDGLNVPLPALDSVPALKAFTRCLRRLRGATDGLEDVDLISVDCQHPKRHLGQLAYCTYLSTPADNDAAAAAPIALPAHHVALMRSPELVVRYSEHSALPMAGVGWAAVFKVARDVEKTFAASEPPTHDDWVVEQIERREDRTFVRVALDRIRESIAQRTTPAIADPAPPGPGGVVKLADLLSGLVAATAGGGASPRSAERSPWTKNRGGARASIELLGPMRLEVDGDGRSGVVSFLVHHARGSAGTRVDGSVGVLLQDGTVERDPPVGGRRAEISGWEADDGELQSALAGLVIDADDGRRWALRVTIPDDVSVAADLHAVALHAS